MRQLWTIIFITLVAIGWSLAYWHDREEKKRQQRPQAAREQRGKSKD
jgi:predicted ribosomally synthesized peptide with SipW-like signal peptide